MRRRWITDAGQPLLVTTSAGESLNIGRYGVWESGDGECSVIDCSDDLQQLQTRYGPGLELWALHQLRPWRRPLTVVEEARQFALAAHGDQRYGDQPYSVHLEAVVNNVQVHVHPHGDEHLCAAWLHDVLEDTQVKEVDIGLRFGQRVLKLVWLLTDDRTGRNRRERHELTYQRLATDREAVAVKLCDRLANAQHSYMRLTESEGDRGLFKMYVKEYPQFRSILWREGEWPGLWHELDNLLLREEKKDGGNV